MEVFGLDTRRSTMRVSRLIGYVTQQLSIDGQLTGYENVFIVLAHLLVDLGYALLDPRMRPS